MRVEEVVHILFVRSLEMIESSQAVIIFVVDPTTNKAAFQTNLVGGHPKLSEALRNIADAIDRKTPPAPAAPPNGDG